MIGSFIFLVELSMAAICQGLKFNYGYRRPLRRFRFLFLALLFRSSSILFLI